MKFKYTFEKIIKNCLNDLSLELVDEYKFKKVFYYKFINYMVDIELPSRQFCICNNKIKEKIFL